MTTYLSIVIPVYNESERIHHLDEVFTFFSSFSFPWEIIVVNDGSQDNTLELLNNWTCGKEFKLISYLQNKGKGYAIKQGMLQARGQFRLFMDIDLSTPLDEFYRFLPLFSHYDIIIGTRKDRVGQILEHQPKFREWLGKGFTLLSRLALQVKVTDFTCGFKCFSSRAAENIFPRLTINRWGFDAEILFLAKELGYSIKEIGVRWRNDPHTKVRLFRDVLRSFHDLIHIRLNKIRGNYHL